MKKLSVFIIATLLLSCGGSTTYTINISMESLADQKVMLWKNESGELVAVDSVQLDENGQGVITGTADVSEIMYIGKAGTRNYLPVFVDNHKYTISGSIEDVNIEADGGPQVEYNNYKENAAMYEEQVDDIVKQWQNANSSGAAPDSINMLTKAYNDAVEKKEEFDSLFIVNQPASAVSAYLLRRSYYKYNAEQLEEQLDRLDPAVHETPYYKTMADHLERMKSVVIGKKYIDFELPDTTGNPMKLSDVAENGVLLIDFWASWCGPCRRANPEVVEIYNEYKDKGFDIVGVSLDNSKEDWLKAIEKDGLTWHHMSDVQGWQSKGAKLYAVNSIPHTVLLDEDGTIIARNLSKEELKEKLDELLN